jgi:hypothetical protein
MKIAMVMASGDSAAMDHWLMSANLAAAELERWIIDGEPEVAEQVLDALVPVAANAGRYVAIFSGNGR